MLPVLLDRPLSSIFQMPISDMFGEMFEPYGIDVWQEKDMLHMRLEMPGFAKEDVSITSNDGLLVVQATRKEEENRKYLIRSSSCSFKRSIPVPEGYDMEKAQATYENGVLTLSMDKAEHKKSRQIQVR